MKADSTRSLAACRGGNFRRSRHRIALAAAGFVLALATVPAAARPPADPQPTDHPSEAKGLEIKTPFTVDSGGGRVTGGTFALTGTIGQPDVGISEDGSQGVLLVGGYWGLSAEIFNDGFETGTTAAWSGAVP